MKELILVDTRTLALVSWIGGFIMLATMLGLWASGTRERELPHWGFGGLFYGLGYLAGYLLLTFEPQVPGWVASSLANNLILYGHILILLGIQIHLGRQPWYWLLLVPLLQAASMNIQALRTFPTPFITDSLLMASPDLIAAWLLWRTRAPGLTLIRRTTAVFLAAFGFFLLGRLGYVLVTRAVSSSFDPHLLQALAFLGGMLFAFFMTMLLVLMIFRVKELQLRRTARRDALTGLRNRLALADLSQKEYHRAVRYESPLSLIALDLDFFKRINDRFGHSAGDRVLVDVAACLDERLRESDLIFRTGGEEFLIVLPHTRGPAAVEVAQRLREGLHGLAWDFAGERVGCSASIGVAEIALPGETWEQALIRVDRALYSAKESGRDQVVEAASAATSEGRIRPAPAPA